MLVCGQVRAGAPALLYISLRRPFSKVCTPVQHRRRNLRPSFLKRTPEFQKTHITPESAFAVVCSSPPLPLIKGPFANRINCRAPGGPAGRWDRIPAPEFARIQIPATGNVLGSARIRDKTHGSQRRTRRANSPKTPSKTPCNLKHRG